MEREAQKDKHAMEREDRKHKEEMARENRVIDLEHSAASDLRPWIYPRSLGVRVAHSQPPPGTF
jgi:hypothetical protein